MEVEQLKTLFYKNKKRTTELVIKLIKNTK